jgi:hypothetical protein
MPPHSAGSRCAAALARWWYSVTWRTAYVLGFRLTAWDRDWPSLHRARHNPARLHRPERLALAGLLAGSRGLTREACAPDLRQFTSWCRARSLVLFTVRRAGIESALRATMPLRACHTSFM